MNGELFIKVLRDLTPLFERQVVREFLQSESTPERPSDESWDIDDEPD